MSQRPPGTEERTTIAPPPTSIPAPSRPLVFPEGPTSKPAVQALAPPAPQGGVLAPAVVLLTLVLAAVDASFGLRGWISVGATSAFSVLVVAWMIVSFWSRPPTGLPRGQRIRLRAAQGILVALVLSVLGAKWLACLHGLDEPAAYSRSYRTYTGILVALLVLGTILRSGRVARFVAASTDHPARLMTLSFAAMAIVGALLLALPISLRRVSDISLLDSLFMSMSAVCVTGLGTVNVAETYSFEGQIVLCALMQAGGLGIMVLTAAVTMLAGRRLDVKSSAVLAEIVDSESLASLRRTILLIVFYTLVIEAIGATTFWLQFQMIAERDFQFGSGSAVAGAESALWAAIFHAVSAFCNSGFSNFPNGMVAFVGYPGICQTMVALIVLGGLGFPVIHELLFRAIGRLRRKRPPRMSLNSRVGLVTTGVLLSAMTVAYLALESSASFAKLSLLERLNAAVFQSASARTAGFNVVDIGAMRPAMLALTCFAMFIGADPGGTAGGIKTTTLAVLFSALRAELRGQRPRLFDRAVPDAVVRRAMGVAFLSTAIVGSVVFLLLMSERHEPLSLFFEAVSAFSTTGLSTGITPQLTAIGKALLIGTMLVGRVGPLTIALALSARARLHIYDLPEERVMIG